MLIFVPWLGCAGQAQVDISVAAGEGGFVFTSAEAEASQPAERVFHNPAVRQNVES